MVSTSNAPVNPQTLIAARELCGYSLKEATGKISPNLARWEKGERQPTWKQVSTLAEIYQLPQNLLFLSQLPDTLLPTEAVDFRVVDRKGDKRVNLRLIQRGGWENRTIALELMTDLGKMPKEFSLDVSQETALRTEDVRQHVAAQILEILGGHLAGHELPFSNAEAAFIYWRTRVEKIGILVFKRKKVTRGILSTENFRGLCLPADPLPVILINHNDAWAGKTFTLMHELVHLARRRGRICAANKDHAEERFCDEIAARILLPADLLRQHPQVRLQTQAKVWSDGEFQSISNHFGVSKQAVLIRLVKLNLASAEDYWHKWHGLFTENEKQRQEKNERLKREGKQSGNRNMPNEKLREFGSSFIALALQAYRQKVLTPRDLLSTLNLKAEYLGDLEKKIPSSRKIAFME